jgi:hypothetical protein
VRRSYISSVGGTKEVRIWSMHFSLVGSLLAVSSDKGRVHVFKLGSAQGGRQGEVKAVGAGASGKSRDSASSPP